jgi:hypothetical protein
MLLNVYGSPASFRIAPILSIIVCVSIYFSRQFLLYSFGLNLLKRRELVTTETELNAIAAAANIGFSNMPKKG